MLNFAKAFLKSHRTQLIIFLVALPYLIAQNLHGGDFRILLTGAGYLTKGVSPYGIVMPIEPGITDVMLYSPFVAFVLIPLTYLPEFIPTFIFTLINFFVLYRIWRIMGIWLKTDTLNNVQKRWWFILSIAFILRFVLHNFEKTQMNIVVFYLSFEGLYQILLRSKSIGGFLLALGICIKLLPLVFLPYLVYRKKINASFATVLFCALLLLLPAAWFGFTFNFHLLQGWWAAINPTLDKYNSQQNVGVYFHCISALIPVYFSDCSYNSFSVNVMNLDPSKLFLLINAIRLVLVAITLFFLLASRNVNERPPLFLFWELSYLFLLIPLIFPHQQKYSYINLLPAFGYIAFYVVRLYPLSSSTAKREKIFLFSAMGLVFTLTTLTADIIWGMSFGKYFQFMKLITVGTIILIPVLAFFSPQRLLREAK
jgi:hypothetical protein